jgi:hypothetical protein
MVDDRRDFVLAMLAKVEAMPAWTPAAMAKFISASTTLGHFAPQSVALIYLSRQM